MEYIIDRKIWRRGGDEYDDLYGETRLLNKEGYMCCLGMVLEQEGCLRSDLFEKGEPCDIVFEPSITIDPKLFINTKLSNRAIAINDMEDISDNEREQNLSELFKENGHSLIFIN